ncbi:hypothetical protein ACWCQM_15070 [Streptomyces sp. NPDC002125]
MSANRQKLIALAFVVLSAGLVGLASGALLALLGASLRDSVTGGAAAGMAAAMFGLAAVAMFRFRDGDDGRPPGTSAP